MTFKESVEILKKIWKEKKLDQAETEALETAVGFMGKVDAEMEFQAMAWDTQICMYIPIGRPVTSENLCRNRYKEKVDYGLMPNWVDPSKYKIAKRTVVTMAGEWEMLGMEDSEDDRN